MGLKLISTSLFQFPKTPRYDFEFSSTTLPMRIGSLYVYIIYVAKWIVIKLAVYI